MFIRSILAVLLSAVICGCSGYDYFTYRPNDLKQRLLDDMYPIMSTQEYKMLDRTGTEEEARDYVEEFWNRNDPTPETPENEFRAEYEKRLEYANAHYPDRRGWGRSDRKRIYLQFGEPVEIQHYNWVDEVLSSGTRIKSAEIWLYAEGAQLSYYKNYFDKTFPQQKKFIFYDTIGSEIYHLAYSTEDMQDIDAILWKGIQEFQYKQN